MTADLFEIEYSEVESLLLAISLIFMAIVFLVAAATVFPFRKGWYKSRRMPAGLGLLVAAGVLGTVAASFFNDWKEQPPIGAARVGIVQEWAETTYGVAVSKEEADSIAKAIRNPYRRVNSTFIVEGAAGVIEVKLLEAEDGTFHMVQATAELPLAEVRK